MTALGPAEPLDRDRHSVAGFACGRSALDGWLRDYAGQGQRRDTSRTFVAARPDGTVLGYYTLVAGQIERDRATSEVRAGTSAHFPIPICLIARLAVDREAQGKGSASRRSRASRARSWSRSRPCGVSSGRT